MTFLARLEELIDNLENQIKQRNDTINILKKELNTLKENKS